MMAYLLASGDVSAAQSNQAATSGKPYDYPKKYLWDVQRVWNIGSSPVSLRDRTTRMGSGRIDMDKLVNSPFGEQMVLAMENFITYTDEMDPKLVAYYQSIGLNKELNESGDYYTRWSCYTPLSMSKPENKNKRYPFLFINHGAGMPMEWEECDGYLPLCAKNEFIAVAAQNHNEDNLLRILNIVKGKYPVDDSRIYSAGYSQGGSQTSMVTLKHPEVFAGSLPGGNSVFYGNTQITDAEVESLRKYDLPVMLVNGQAEGVFPLYQVQQSQAPPPGPLTAAGRGPTSPATGAPSAAAPAGAGGRSRFDPADPTLRGMGAAPAPGQGAPSDPIERNVALLNRRLYSARCRQVTKDEVLATKDSANEVMRAHGIPYDRTEVREIYGVKHFIGEFKNDKGQYLLRFISVDNHPHWPPCTMPALHWEFIAKYGRNPQTKQLVTLK
jgi:hypothetical protein